MVCQRVLTADFHRSRQKDPILLYCDLSLIFLFALQIIPNMSTCRTVLGNHMYINTYNTKYFLKQARHAYLIGASYLFKGSWITTLIIGKDHGAAY